MKLMGWIVVACFAVAAAGMVTVAARWLGAPGPLRAFLIAAIGAVATCYGPRLLTTLTRTLETR